MTEDVSVLHIIYKSSTIEVITIKPENCSTARKISHIQKMRVNKELIKIKHTDSRGVRSRVRYLVLYSSEVRHICL